MTNIINLADFATQFGGTTEKLIAKGSDPYERKSVEDARSEFVERMESELAVVDAHIADTEKNELKSFVVRRIRNGYAVKMGYGAKNERFRKGDKPINFVGLQDARSYFTAAIDAAKEGSFDGLLEAKLDELTKRAAEARAKKKAA